MIRRLPAQRIGIALLPGLLASRQPEQAQGTPNRLPQLKVEADPMLKELAPQIHARCKSPLDEALISPRGNLVVLPATESKGAGEIRPLEYRLSVSRDQKESKNRTRNVVEDTVRPRRWSSLIKPSSSATTR